MSDVFTLSIESININDSLDPRRSQRDKHVIERYAENIDNLPPIIVDQDNNVLDGIHRIEAHRLMGRAEIKAKRVIVTAREALLFSVAQNTKHGLALNNNDLAEMASRFYLRWGESDEEIAQAIGRSEATVQVYLKDTKATWKAETRKKAYVLYNGTEEYTEKRLTKEWSQKQIAEELSGPGQLNCSQKTISNYIREHKEMLKAAKEEAERLKEEADNKIAVEDKQDESEVLAKPEHKDETETRNDDISEFSHSGIQNMLLRLGEEMGLKLWLAKDNQNDTELSSYNISKLPVQKWQGARTIIERIDVMWIEDDRIIAAFEVEHSTSIYSGLLRLSDLKIVTESQPYLYVVADRENDNRVRNEINRPSFTKLELDCGYIPYDLLNRKYNEVTQSTSSLSGNWRQLLAEISETT